MIAEITEEQLLELQRLATLGRLMASVTHELSAPIGSILSNTETEMRLIERLESALAEQPSAEPRNWWRPAEAWCRSTGWLVSGSRLW